MACFNQRSWIYFLRNLPNSCESIDSLAANIIMQENFRQVVFIWYVLLVNEAEESRILKYLLLGGRIADIVRTPFPDRHVLVRKLLTWAFFAVGRRPISKIMDTRLRRLLRIWQNNNLHGYEWSQAMISVYNGIYPQVLGVPDLKLDFGAGTELIFIENGIAASKVIENVIDFEPSREKGEPKARATTTVTLDRENLEQTTPLVLVNNIDSNTGNLDSKPCLPFELTTDLICSLLNSDNLSSMSENGQGDSDSDTTSESSSCCSTSTFESTSFDSSSGSSCCSTSTSSSIPSTSRSIPSTSSTSTEDDEIFLEYPKKSTASEIPHFAVDSLNLRSTRNSNNCKKRCLSGDSLTNRNQGDQSLRDKFLKKCEGSGIDVNTIAKAYERTISDVKLMDSDEKKKPKNVQQEPTTIRSTVTSPPSSTFISHAAQRAPPFIKSRGKDMKTIMAAYEKSPTNVKFSDEEEEEKLETAKRPRTVSPTKANGKNMEILMRYMLEETTVEA